MHSPHFFLLTLTDNGWGDSAPNSGRASPPPRDEPRGGYECVAYTDFYPSVLMLMLSRRDARDNRDSGRPQRDSGNDANPGNNLHIAGLAMKTRESDLEEIFGKFGKVSSDVFHSRCSFTRIRFW